MAMPLNFILVRHGESEGNVAGKRSKKGDHSDFTSEYRARHSSKWRLTDKGVEQAKAAGAWLHANGLGGQYFRYYVSSYLRAMETAYHLQLADADWRILEILRERDWGELDTMTVAERQEVFAHNLAMREADRYFWRTPNGESMADMVIRLYPFFDQLHRECANVPIVGCVCHGEVMWAIRCRLEYILPDRFNELDLSTKPFDQIHNGQILHYTRVNPVTQVVATRLRWVRSICPWDLSRSSNDWREIIRPKFNNDDLLAMVNKHSRLVE